ncbi:hypothetical protein ACFQZ4_04265 [Catellatospora coxensis]
MVEHPVIEVAELVRMAADGPVFNWSAWELRRPPADGEVQVKSSPLHPGYFANIWNCTGVTLGNHNDLDLTYLYRMSSCRVNLLPLLRDPRISAELALCADESPENAEHAAAARSGLQETVATVVGAMDLSNLVSEQEIAAHAARMRLPRVRGRGSTIAISHGAGVAIGTDLSVTSGTRFKVGRPRVT